MGRFPLSSLTLLLAVVGLCVAPLLGVAQSSDFTASHQVERDAVSNLEAYAAFKLGDKEEARRIWTRLAERGNTTAMWNLSHLLEQQTGDPKALQEAFALVRKAAELGDARAQYQLGIAYEKGEQVERNLEAAGEWLSRSARQHYADGQLAYGILLATNYGQGIDSLSEARRQQAQIWLSRAARAGLPDAQQYLDLLIKTAE